MNQGDEAVTVLTVETARAYALAHQEGIRITHIVALHPVVHGVPAIDVHFVYADGCAGCMTVWIEDGELYGEW